MARCLISLLLLVAFASTALLAQAADMPLRDPTRPADASAPDSTDMPEESLSIIRPMGGKTAGKPRAIVDGTLVSVGDKIGDATVMAIGTDRVMLKNTDGSSETRLLTPGIDKKPVARPSLNSRTVPRQP